MTAKLSDITLRGFFRDGETPVMILNPVLLDALSQITAFWTAQVVGTDFNCFPSRVGRIELYAPCPQDRNDLKLQARKQGDDWDFECTDDSGHVLLRAHKLRNIYFDVPHKFYQCRFDPLNGWLGNPVESENADVLRWYLPHLPENFCLQSNGMFIRILAWCILDESERAEWQALNVGMAEKARWLFRRACVKEAVRYHICHQTGQLLYPSDIRVTDSNGIISVDGWWRDNHLAEAPAVFVEGDKNNSFATVADAGTDTLPARAYK